MIKSLTVTNTIGESLTLELTKPEKTGIAIKSIDGLGTPEFIVNMTPFGSSDGSILGSVKAESRTITITVWPLFNPRVEDSRQLLYRYFQVKKPIELTIAGDNRVLMAEGYVESITPNIFTNPETVQITIICPDPYFHKAFNESSGFFGRIPLFEFPFSNESFTEKLIEMSMISVDHRAMIEYEGEIDGGIQIIIDCETAPGTISVFNVDTLGSIILDKERMRAIVSGGVIAHDRIEINTESGNRYARLLRNGVYYNILGAVNRNIDWFKLRQGPNLFTYTTDDPTAIVVMTFKYRSTYAAF